MAGLTATGSQTGSAVSSDRSGAAAPECSMFMIRCSLHTSDQIAIAIATKITNRIRRVSTLRQAQGGAAQRPGGRKSWCLSVFVAYYAGHKKRPSLRKAFL